MSGSAVVLDTNIIVLHITGKQPIDLSDKSVIISTLTVFELLQYSKLSQAEEKAIYDIIDTCLVIPVSQSIAESAARLERSKTIGVVDAIIAATALEFGAALMTKNIKDFRHIRGLELV